MFKSIASKIISICLGIFVIVLGISTFVNYKQTSAETIEVYEGLQKLALNSSYLTINITMNTDAINQMSGLANLISSIDRYDFMSHRRTFLNLARFMGSPLVFVIYENDGKLISETAKSKESNFKNGDDGNAFDFRQREWYQKQRRQKSLWYPTHTLAKWRDMRALSLRQRQCRFLKMANLWALSAQM